MTKLVYQLPAVPSNTVIIGGQDYTVASTVYDLLKQLQKETEPVQRKAKKVAKKGKKK